MRRILLVVLSCMMALLLVSCEKVRHDAALDDIDSLSYAVGKLNGIDMKGFLQSQGIDDEDLGEVIKGIQEGMASVGDKRKFAYYFGVLQGLSMMENANRTVFRFDSTQSLSQHNLMAGLLDGINNRRGVIPGYQVKKYIDKKSEEIVAGNLLKLYGSNKEKSEQFMAGKYQDQAVTKLRNGVCYTPLKIGAGIIPCDTSRVVANVEMKTIDGRVISDSWKSNQPFANIANQTIPGITEALVHMPVGSTWEVYIPWQQAYGHREAGDIKPYTALVCKIQLLEANN